MQSRNPAPLDPENLAISALAWLAADEERLTRFLALTGIDASDIRTVAKDPGFLGAVLDHILADERLLEAFAGETAVDPAAVAAARTRLPGASREFNS
ncbi:MAG: DUF3572 domain-containing protein [Beijerinckiaceae bacterium]